MYMHVPKKFVIGGAAILAVAAFFTATQPITPAMSIVSSVFVVLFALPSYYAIIDAKGAGKGLVILSVLGIYALLIESSAIHTGFPYGDFIYNDLLGQKIFGLTPWTVAFAWPPILLIAYWFAQHFTSTVATHKTLKTLSLTAIGAMAIDVVLDPAAVYLGFWGWEDPGFFYGVPLVNFAGWLLSGFIGAVILHTLWGKKTPPASIGYSGLAILWFWTIANVFMLQVVPVLVGIALLMLFFRTMRSEKGIIRDDE
jgi:putative membrane protein